MLLSFADWVHDFSYEKITATALKKAKLQLLNMLAAYFASRQLPEAKKLASLTPSCSSSMKSLSLPEGERVPLSQALFKYSTLSMMMDYDDYLLAGHTGHSTVFLPLSLLYPCRLSGRDFLLLQVLGNECEARLGLSVLLGPLNGQMWSFLHSFGTAAMMGKLESLPPSKLHALLSLSLAFPHHLTPAAFFASHAKYFTASYPITYGLQSLEWVKQGLSASDLLFSAEGFVSSFAAASLEKAFLTDFLFTETLSYKPYPGCAYIDAPVDALLKIKSEAPSAFPDQVQVSGNLFTVWMEKWGRKYLHQKFRHTKNFTVPFNLVTAWHHDDLKAKHFLAPPSARWVNDRCQRIRLHHDPRLTLLMLQKGKDLLSFFSGWKQKSYLLQMIGRSLALRTTSLKDFALPLSSREPLSSLPLAIPFPCQITARYGREVFTSKVIYPKGSYGTPLSEQAAVVKEKFLYELTPYTSAAQRETLLNALMNLESLDHKAFKEALSSLIQKKKKPRT